MKRYDLTGKCFGELQVLHKADFQRKNGGIWWTCRCSCGAEYNKAVEVRRKAEELIHGGTIDHYAKWKAKADSDPAWAEENPIQIHVEQNADRELSVSFFPTL